MLIMLVLLLTTASWPARSDPIDPCRTDVALRMLERAMQSRDDFFLWDEIDEREASAELERYLFRLDRLKRFVTDCAPGEPAIAALEWQVSASLKQALNIANVRKSAANKEASSKP